MGWFKKDRFSRGAKAVVTGAGSGIGRAFALELAARGGQVVCSDINLESAQETVDMIEATGAKAFAVACDVSNFDQVQKLAETAAELLGAPVDLLINNAGIGIGGRFSDTSLEDWKWAMGINLWGVIHGCHAFVPSMKATGRGAIINVASAAAYTSAPEMSTYNVTKSGVLTLTETLSGELKKDGIRLSALCPTLVPTNIIKSGKLPGKYQKLADHMLTNYSFVTAKSVAALTLDRLDRGKLYTMPQPDAKLLWLIKRTLPATYTQLFGLSYRFVGGAR